MGSKVCSDFADAINEVKDGASIMIFCWGVSGTPQNLIYELYKKGVKDLTIICHNFLPAFINGEILWDVVTPYILSGQVRKLITAWPGSSILGVKSQVEEKIKKGEVELEFGVMVF
jgi:3-oxoacid CoA-transferase subunit A